MATVNLYVDVLTRRAVRSPSSASPAPRPDFRDPTAHTLNVYFMRRNGTAENYDYSRFASGTPQARLRRDKPPDFCSFILSFEGYDTPAIDSRLTNEGIAALIGAAASIGKGNIEVTGNLQDGWTIEFVGDMAGYTQPIFTGRIVAPITGDVVIKQTNAGGSGVNAVQTIKLRESPLAIGTGWSELTAGSHWGWSATLDTTDIPQSSWNAGELLLEISLEAINVRTGTDGITSLEGTSRSGSDGEILAVGAETGRMALMRMSQDGVAYFIAQEGSANYGALFTQDDVGRSISGQFIVPGATITAVILNDDYNAATLSSPFFNGYQETDPPSIGMFDLGGLASRVFKSASANFTDDDVGHAVTGAGFADNTIIKSIIAEDTVKLSQIALSSGTGKDWTITAIPGDIFESAAALFSSVDVGARLEAPQIPIGTIIAEIIDSTHARISRKALGVASGQSWTLRPKIGFSSPSVSSVTPGSLSANEKQRITLTQAPVSGKILIQDGGDVSMPAVEIEAPLTAQAIQSALNIGYPNYKGVQVTEIIPNGQYDIVFGIFGRQYLLSVDESQAVYQTNLASVPVGSQPQSLVSGGGASTDEIQAPAVVGLKIHNLIMLGVTNIGWTAQTRWPVWFRTSDGTNGIEFHFYYASVIDGWSPPAIGSRPPDVTGFDARFDRVENVEDRAGIRLFEWIGYSKPPNRTERIQQQRPTYIMPIQLLNNQIIDVQLMSWSQSTWMDAIYKYFPISSPPSLPNDGPFGAVIHFAALPGFQAQEFAFGGGGFGLPHGTSAGAGTYGGQFTQSWARRRWRSDIWEQVEYRN